MAAEAEGEGSHLKPQAGSRKKKKANLQVKAFKLFKPASCDNCLQQGNPDPPQTATNWGLRIQMPEAM